MEHLPELTNAYLAMSPWARSLLRDIAKDYARQFPAPKKQPALALVSGNRVNIQAATNLLDDSINCSAPISIGKPVDGKKA